MQIISEFSDFKRSIIYKNRFFFVNDPFLDSFKKLIERDLKQEEPIMVSTLPKGNLIYRARIMNLPINNTVTELMQASGSEVARIKRCKSCQDYSTCSSDGVAASQKCVEGFRCRAKEQLEKVIASKENNFNGYDSLGSSLPPIEQSDNVSDMRANPKYIRYLYAANDVYTALLEARSNINALVSVANIEILESLRILDITNPAQYTMSNDEADQELFFLLQELRNEFSTPVSGELKDYLTSQVISEFIKQLDYTPIFDGICFKSSLNPNGKNYTIFSEKKFRPISSDVYYINEIGLIAYGITHDGVTKIDADTPNSHL